jgi:hypothetical protein
LAASAPRQSCREYPADNGVVLLPLADGTVLSPDDCIYPDIENAKATILAQHQANWDQRAAERGPVAT